ncbi:MAG: tetratricopeptide repeat protein [Planctomycetota bacterium]
MRSAWLLPTLVAGIVFAAFFPSLRNGFNYDDEANIISNPHYRGLGGEQLKWMFTTFHMGHYQPLSWITLGLDYLIWKDNPFGYHLTNLLLHIANALVVYGLALRLLAARGRSGQERCGTGIQAPAETQAGSLCHNFCHGLLGPPNSSAGSTKHRPSSAAYVGAALAALLFAVHPLRVESVAWVTERRDVLSSFFLLATVLAYLRAHQQSPEPHPRRWLPVVLGLYVLSLLSRAMGVTLPLILLVLDWYPLHRLAARGKSRSTGFQPVLSRARCPCHTALGHFHHRLLGGGSGRWLGREVRAVWLEKLPFALLAAAFAIVAPLAQRNVGAALSLAEYPLQSRIAQACYGLVFYLWKTVVPIGLVPMYELHPPLKLFDPRYLLSALIVILVVAGLLTLGRRRPAVTAAALCYAVLLLPLLGLVQSGQQEVADRYSYLPSVGWAVLIGSGVARLWHSARARRPVVVGGSIAGVLLIAGGSILTWRQCAVWKDPYTLWSHAIAHGAPCATAHYNLAVLLARQRRITDAIDHFHETLRINPRYPDAYYNLGNALTEVGRTEEAIQAYRQALRVNPDYAQAHYELARTLAATDASDQAVQHYRRALEINPDYVQAHYELANVLVAQGVFDQAVEHYRRALELKPDHADAHVNLGVEWQRQGRYDLAIAEYAAALQIDPDHAPAHYNLGNALSAQNQTDEAIAEYRQALRINPRYVEAHINLGNLLRKNGQPEAAIAEYREAIRVGPREVIARCNLAATLAAEGKRAEALEVIREALEIAPHHPAARRIFEMLQAGR